MNIKLILYAITVPFCMWIVIATNLDKLFKKNNEFQIHCAYFTLSLIFSYLLVNFIMDIFNTTRFL